MTALGLATQSLPLVGVPSSKSTKISTLLLVVEAIQLLVTRRASTQYCYTGRESSDFPEEEE